jgi:hypothetical protein
MRPENNNYGNRVVPAKNWDLTPDGPVCMDVYMTTTDIMPLMRRMYGVKEGDTDIHKFEPDWADNHPELVAMFFSNVDILPSNHKIEMGFSG